MKKFVVMSLFLFGCGAEPMQNLSDGTFEKAGESIDKAWSDTKAEGRRFNNNFNEGKENVNDTLVKANLDVVEEEKKFNERVKETGKKTNMDVLDEEKRFNERVKDTAYKTNMDIVEEERKFNERSKETAKKANMDVIAEGDKLTDRIVGSDDKTIDQHGDDIRDLQRRVALIEALNASQDALLGLHSTHLATLDSQIEALTQEISRVDLSLLSEVARLDGVDSDLRAELLLVESRLQAAINSVSEALDQEATERALADIQLAEQIAQEAEARELADEQLLNKIRNLRAKLRDLRGDFRSFRQQQLWNNYRQKQRIDRLARKVRDLRTRMTEAESDISTLSTLVESVTLRVDSLESRMTDAESDISSLEAADSATQSAIDALETAIEADCTLSVVGSVSSVNVESCNSLNGWGVCTGIGTRRTLYSADIELQCLGKSPSTIEDVLFSSNPS